MTSDNLRREFLLTIGKTYSTYGYPETCGWIEGLLHLEERTWTQTTISDRLKAILPDSKYPTSVPSVNRAMKILEAYGVVSKTGSRRGGFLYTLKPAKNLVSNMLLQMIAVYESFIEKMKQIGKEGAGDKDLKRAINSQIAQAKKWNEVIGKSLELVKER